MNKQCGMLKVMQKRTKCTDKSRHLYILELF